MALKATGFDPGSFEAMEQSLGAPPPSGYSLLQLKDQAAKCGAHAIAVDSNLENIRARKRPFGCVALLRKEHFAVLYDADETTAYLIDNFRPVELPIETFRALWTGKALILGQGPLAAEESIRPRNGLWFWGSRLSGPPQRWHSS